MLSAVVFAAFAAAPGPIKLASPGFSGAGVEAARLTFYSDHTAAQLGFRGIRVITSSEIGQLLGLERQKQLMNCGDQSAACMTELANALGVDGLLVGQVAHVGKGFRADLKIIAVGDARPLAAYSAQAGSEEELVKQLELGASNMADEVAAKLGRTLTPAHVTSSSASYALIPAVAGVVLAGLGTAALVVASNKDSQLKTGPFPSYAAASSTASDGKTFQTLGVVGLIAGGVGLVGGGTLWLLAQPSAQSGVASGPTMGLGWAGVFP